MKFDFRNREKYQFSIRRALLFFPFLFFVILSPLAFLQLSHAEQTAEKEAFAFIDHESEYLTSYLEEVMARSADLNAYNALEIKRQCAPRCSQAGLQALFLREVQTFADVSSIYFGNLEGGLADAGREAASPESYYFISTENFAAGKLSKVAAGDPEKILFTLPEFDARRRAWYGDALESGKNTLGDIYLLSTGQDMALSSSLPVYGEEGQLLGVAANDIFLSHISDYLTVYAREEGEAAHLVDREGFFVASSVGNPIALQGDAPPTRKNLFAENDLIDQAFAARLEQEGISLANLEQPRYLTLSLPEGVYYAGIQPLSPAEGQDWYLIILLPQQLFLSGILAHRSILLLSFGAITLFALILTWFSNRWIAQPLRTLTAAVEKFNAREQKEIESTSRLSEVRLLADSFNAMNADLQKNMLALEREAQQHREAKDELAASEARYRAVVEDAPSLVTAFLPDGEITFVNQQYANFYQKTVKELIGVNFLAFLPEEEAEKVMRELQSLTPEKSVSALSQLVVTPDGKRRHQRWVNRALFNEQGEVISYLSFGEDIEEAYKQQIYQDVLHEAARAANQAMDLERIAPALHEMVARLMPAENFHLTRYERETNRFIPIFFADQKDTLPFMKPKLLEESQSLTAFLIRGGKNLRLNRADYQALVNEGKIKVVGTEPVSWLGVLLRAQNEILGVLTVQDYQRENLYSEKDEKRLNQIASAIANILIQQRARDQLANHAQMNARLFQAAQEISKTLELPRLYRQLYAIIKKAMPVDSFFISAFDPKEEMITASFILHDGKEEDPAALPPIPLEPEGSGIQSRVIRSGEPLKIDDFLRAVQKTQTAYYIDDEGEIHDHKSVDPGEEPQTQSALLVPLKLHDQVRGVLQVLSCEKYAYKERDLRFLNLLASQISVSLDNARLFEQLQKELERRHHAEKDLRELNQQLEARITMRTSELEERVKIVESLNLGMKNMMNDLNLANQLSQEKTQALKESNQELEAFTYSVSHDLRAPLRHLESFSLLLQQGEEKFSPDSQRYLDNIMTAAVRMRKLIEDLLSLSRTGRKEMRVKVVDLNAIIESVLAQQFDEVDGREIVWEIASLPPARVDAGLIKILWENLIGNALKYTRPREKTVIEIGSQIRDGKQTYFIRDNGVGFPIKYIEKIFKPFERLHQSDQFEGTGIGLAIAKRVVERHQGEIWAESEEGKGAFFGFTLNSKSPSES